MLKAAIIGCGKIADDHAACIRRVPGSRLVAACDRETLMARQLAERFGIDRHFSDVAEMLSTIRPDVVHITTPPAGHFQLGKLCLESGSHVYIEKPLTLNTADAEALVDCAMRQGRKLTVGHDLQFSHVSRRTRALVQEGYLGGPPLHMESYYCYDLSHPSYAKALLGDKDHWVRKLPGKLLHNIISHGVARIAEYFPSDFPTVVAHGFVSPVLRSLGEDQIIDELRVVISDQVRTTAYFTFSSQMRPSLNQFRLYGPENGLIADQDRQMLIKSTGKTFKSYAEKFIPPFILAKECLGNIGVNLRHFLKNDFHMKAGMRCLIESFYDSIRTDGPVPISYREILLTSRIMDAIFEQISPAENKSQQASVSSLKASLGIEEFPHHADSVLPVAV